MKQISNGFRECYFLKEDGRVYNEITEKYLSIDKKYCYKLMTTAGQHKKIALKTLYKLVYGKPYCKDNIKPLHNEEWKEIEGTDGNYYVSNLGRLKSYKGYEALLMKPYLTANGYERVDIVLDNMRVSKLVHRLTASAFLPAPEKIDMVLHHKDNNKLNNRSDNLEWLTHKQHIEKHYPKETETNDEQQEETT